MRAKSLEVKKTKDKQIIELFFSRNEQALKEVEAVYGKSLSDLAYRILGNKEDAEETVSDAYLNAWNSIPPQKPEHFFAYLSALCRNCAFDRLGKQKAQKRNATLITLSEELEISIPDRMHTIETALTRQEIAEYFNEFLGTLSKENRIIFLRRYWFSESIKEIALQLNLSESKIKTSLHRTRKKLHTFLERKELYL